MKIGVIINIIIIFLVIFFTLLDGILSFFIKWRIKSMNLRYSYNGHSRPYTADMAIYNANSLLTSELRNIDHRNLTKSQEYYDLMDFNMSLPILDMDDENIKNPNIQRSSKRYKYLHV